MNLLTSPFIFYETLSKLRLMYFWSRMYKEWGAFSYSQLKYVSSCRPLWENWKWKWNALSDKRGLFERACPSISYHTKIQYERALRGIWWCDIGRAFTIQERASFWGRYILKRAPFIKGHFDVDFIIALPFLSYISKKNPIMSQLMA